jgi:hypothetical protein
MVRLSQPLYTTQLPQENSYEALPEGQYLCVIKKAELKDNKAKNGQGIQCQYQIIDGQYKGKTFKDWVNISNPDQQTVEIGLKRINTLLTIACVQVFEDTDQLCNPNVAYLVTLGFKKELYQGYKQNAVVRIENPNKPQQQSPQPTMQPIQSQSYVAQQPIQAQSAYQQPQQQYAPVAQPQQQWQAQQPQPVAPTIQTTQQMLNDEIPWN